MRLRLRVLPGPLEAVGGGGEEGGVGGAVEVEDWGCGGGGAVDVGVGEQAVIGAEDRVVEDRAVVTEFYAVLRGQRLE